MSPKRSLPLTVPTEPDRQSLDLTKKKRLPAHYIRSMSVALDGPGFVCPMCHNRFKLSYGKFGHWHCFQQDTYYCRCCAKGAGFVSC